VAKGPEAFRTISEAAAELNVPQHVLRFWETKFSFIRPMKRAGGRRFYRPQDVAVLRGVRRLLHDEGYTIKGVQRLHKEQGVKRLVAAGLDAAAPAPHAAASEFEPPPPASAAPPPMRPDRRERLLAALADLEAARASLDALLAR
jgi:DNA-binding transcriptional MerR regulator